MSQEISGVTIDMPLTIAPLILIGDVFARLRQIPDNSIDCVVTSPPYWGLRDYGVEGQLGLEPTLAEHIETVVRYCAEVMRVLKPTGTFWLNYGDCYAASPNGRSAADTKATGKDDRAFRDKPFSTIGSVGNHKTKRMSDRGGRWGGGNNPATGYLKAKDLCMVPNRIAIALQDAGWWVRSEIVWAKPNPMPESVTDRPATSHEKIFLLTKSARYFYAADAVRQGLADSSVARLAQDIENQKGSNRAHAGGKTNGRMKAVGGHKKIRGLDPRHAAGDHDHTTIDTVGRGSRNLRNWEPAFASDQPEVWKIATRPFSQAHFATFPPALAERCILAGCPEGGIVLDIFGGAGTTGLVANRLQRRSILIELNPEYAEIARARISGDAPLFLSAPASPASSAQSEMGL